MKFNDVIIPLEEIKDILKTKHSVGLEKLNKLLKFMEIYRNCYCVSMLSPDDITSITDDDDEENPTPIYLLEDFDVDEVADKLRDVIMWDWWKNLESVLKDLKNEKEWEK